MSGTLKNEEADTPVHYLTRGASAGIRADDHLLRPRHRASGMMRMAGDGTKDNVPVGATTSRRSTRTARGGRTSAPSRDVAGRTSSRVEEQKMSPPDGAASSSRRSFVPASRSSRQSQNEFSAPTRSSRSRRIILHHTCGRPPSLVRRPEDVSPSPVGKAKGDTPVGIGGSAEEAGRGGSSRLHPKLMKSSTFGSGKNVVKVYRATPTRKNKLSPSQAQPSRLKTRNSVSRRSVARHQEEEEGEDWDGGQVRHKVSSTAGHDRGNNNLQPNEHSRSSNSSTSSSISKMNNRTSQMNGNKNHGASSSSTKVKLSSRDFFEQVVTKTVDAISEAIARTSTVATSRTQPPGGGGSPDSPYIPPARPSASSSLGGQLHGPAGAGARVSASSSSGGGHDVPTRRAEGHLQHQQRISQHDDLHHADDPDVSGDPDVSFLYDKSGRPVMPSPFSSGHQEHHLKKHSTTSTAAHTRTSAIGHYNIEEQPHLPRTSTNAYATSSSLGRGRYSGLNGVDDVGTLPWTTRPSRTSTTKNLGSFPQEQRPINAVEEFMHMPPTSSRTSLQQTIRPGTPTEATGGRISTELRASTVGVGDPWSTWASAAQRTGGFNTEETSLLTSIIGPHRSIGLYGDDVDWCKPYYIVEEEETLVEQEQDNSLSNDSSPSVPRAPTPTTSRTRRVSSDTLLASNTQLNSRTASSRCAKSGDCAESCSSSSGGETDAFYPATSSSGRRGKVNSGKNSGISTRSTTSSPTSRHHPRSGNMHQSNAKASSKQSYNIYKAATPMNSGASVRTVSFAEGHHSILPESPSSSVGDETKQGAFRTLTMPSAMPGATRTGQHQNLTASSSLLPSPNGTSTTTSINKRTSQLEDFQSPSSSAGGGDLHEKQEPSMLDGMVDLLFGNGDDKHEDSGDRRSLKGNNYMLSRTSSKSTSSRMKNRKGRSRGSPVDENSSTTSRAGTKTTSKRKESRHHNRESSRRHRDRGGNSDAGSGGRSHRGRGRDTRRTDASRSVSSSSRSRSKRTSRSPTTSKNRNKDHSRKDRSVKNTSSRKRIRSHKGRSARERSTSTSRTSSSSDFECSDSDEDDATPNADSTRKAKTNGVSKITSSTPSSRRRDDRDHGKEKKQKHHQEQKDPKKMTTSPTSKNSSSSSGARRSTGRTRTTDKQATTSSTSNKKKGVNNFLSKDEDENSNGDDDIPRRKVEE
ncbi:unnamed protein product [Amoebophrya sp. A25]|nr:unnamed protein product [Amoebophrya sp. A25]|eukprot:GSA25T00023805001.1